MTPYILVFAFSIVASSFVSWLVAAKICRDWIDNYWREAVDSERVVGRAYLEILIDVGDLLRNRKFEEASHVLEEFRKGLAMGGDGSEDEKGNR